jgi:hypothetical protein
MQINWMIVTYFVIGIFALTGFSRGWWKEAFTLVFLGILVFLLQNPDVAQAVIDFINNLLVALWSLIPLSLQPSITDIIDTIFAIDSGGGPPQLDATSPGTWMFILALTVTISILWGRLWLRLAPTTQGSLLGLLIGGLNGFIVLNLAREYLDGRALPGSANEAQVSGIILAGNSDFGTAASALTIQATNLPNFTILDSIVPWLIIGAGLLFLFSILKTRFRILRNQQGMAKIDYLKPPPFYRLPPQQPKPREQISLLQQ